MSSQGFTDGQVRRAQEIVSRIEGISSCHITVGDDGDVAEVHVVATLDKSPKLIAREVESCLKSEIGMDVDYKKIGVVVFDPGVQAAEETDSDGLKEFPIEEHPPRFIFTSVSVSSSRTGVKAEVELNRDTMDSFGASEACNVATAPWNVIGDATLRAVAEFLDEKTRLCLVEVLKVELGGKQAFVTRVDLLDEHGTRSLAGCSIVHGDEHQSVAYATLDAVNRVVGKLEFKSSIEYKIR